MPNYILHRNYVHRSTSGVLSFTKGEPTFVPPHMEKEVVLIGGVIEEGSAPEVLEAEKVEITIPVDGERKDKLISAMRIVVERNDSADFTGSGRPNVKALERILDFSVEAKEVGAAWDELKVLLAEGK